MDKVGKPLRKAPIKRGTRGVKACDYCKKMKTKCVPSPIPGQVKCLKCDSLNRHCSFEDLFAKTPQDVACCDSDAERAAAATARGSDATQTELLKAFIKSGSESPSVMSLNLKYTKMIHDNVERVLGILEGSVPAAGASLEPESRTAQVDSARCKGGDSGMVKKSPNDDESGQLRRSTISKDSQKRVCENELPYMVSPFTVVSQLVPKDHLPLLVRKLHDHRFNEFEGTIKEDIVTMNIVTLEEAYILMHSFRSGYSEWCSFPESVSSERLVDNLRSQSCPLLLTVTCTLALRYTDEYHDLKTRCYKNLLLKLRSDLESSLCYVPQSIEFLQAIVILSVYASSFSSDFQCFDPWHLSSLGIQQMLTRNVAGTLLNSRKPVSNGYSSIFRLLGPTVQPGSTAIMDNSTAFEEAEEYQNLHSSRLWNHLCLSHLNSCIDSGRMCTVDDRRLDLCARTLNSPQSTSFDERMVAVIELSRIIYQFLKSIDSVDTSSREPLDLVSDKAENWLNRWSHFPDQSMTQFIEFHYHYASCMIYYSWYHSCYSQSGNCDVSSSYNSCDTSNKTGVADYLNHVVPLKKVVETISPSDVTFMLKHGRLGLNIVVNCPFVKFKYLSDHLVFSSVHLALLCLLLLDYNRPLLENQELKVLLSDVKKVSQRLQRIREGELKSFWVEEVDLRIPSVILQYHKAIEGYLMTSFSA